MIEEKLILHDKFSVELKFLYESENKTNNNDFAIEVWFFVPNSLDINEYNYDKNRFYADLKTNIRLISPVYSLFSICQGKKIPYDNLISSINTYLLSQNNNKENNLEYNIRMFISIFKASCRDAINEIRNTTDKKIARLRIKDFLINLDIIVRSYRSIKIKLDSTVTSQSIINAYVLGDEYICILIEQNLFYLLKSIKNSDSEFYIEEKFNIVKYISKLIDYKKSQSYNCIKRNDKNKNLEIIYKRGVLKRYFEGLLFLSTRSKKDGIFAIQFFYGVSAAIAMIFATASAFVFQKYYGSFSLPFFIALVCIYVFKDRIKDVSKLYFKGKLNKLFYDIKTSIRVRNNQNIGWCKESFSFVSKAMVPKQVLIYRNKSRIINVEAKGASEKIIYYRKALRIKKIKLKNIYGNYNIIGLNDIIRFNITRFVAKMDNPEVPLYTINDSADGYEKIYGDKVYFMNLILRYKTGDIFRYSKYRIVFNRLGVHKIDKM